MRQELQQHQQRLKQSRCIKGHKHQVTVRQRPQTSSHGASKVANIKSPIQQFEQGLLEQKHLVQEQKVRQELQRHQQRLKQSRCVEGLVPEVSPVSILAHGIAVVAALPFFLHRRVRRSCSRCDKSLKLRNSKPVGT